MTVEDAAIFNPQPTMPVHERLSLHAQLSAHALLLRSAGHDADPYERTLQACLSQAHSALCQCPPGPLRERLVRELGTLAQSCARDAALALRIWLQSQNDADRIQWQTACRIADAAQALSTLAGLPLEQPTAGMAPQHGPSAGRGVNSPATPPGPAAAWPDH